jgi:hypothetical protein
LEIRLHRFFRLDALGLGSNDSGHRFKKLTHFLKGFIILFFIRIFQLYKLDRGFGEVSHVGLTLISVFIHISWPVFNVLFTKINSLASQRSTSTKASKYTKRHWHFTVVMNNKTFYNLVFKNKKKNWFFFSFQFFLNLIL